MSNDAAVLARIMERTLRYCEGRSCEDFERDLMLQEACVFNVLQIGELTKKGLSDAFIQAHPDIPWRQMYGLRNRIVHGYEGILLTSSLTRSPATSRPCSSGCVPSRRNPQTDAQRADGQLCPPARFFIPPCPQTPVQTAARRRCCPRRPAPHRRPRRSPRR